MYKHCFTRFGYRNLFCGASELATTSCIVDCQHFFYKQTLAKASRFSTQNTKARAAHALPLRQNFKDS
jgi:hypothetical protein